jgi:hypothetical protein
VARRGCGPALGLGAVAVLMLLVALVAALNAIGCCAIDCEKFPDQCAKNKRRQETASVVLLGALAASAASMGGAIYVYRRRC